MEQQRLRVDDVSQVGAARRLAVTLAGRAGFDETASGRVGIVATELAANLLRHAVRGELLVGAFEAGQEPGLELLAIDHGPGMADVPACLRDGYSTAGSAGQGLGAVTRQADEVDIYSQPRVGTVIMARVRARRRAPAAPGPVVHGAVSLPKEGQEICGDGWAVQAVATGAAQLLVADGLGHGPLAAEAAREGVRSFRRAAGAAPAEIIRRLHEDLRAGRGAAVAVATLDPLARRVAYCGVGNIAAALVTPGKIQRMVSLNGTAGHHVHKVQEFGYTFEGVPLVILHSDGLGSGWALDRYPGLVARHPAVIAAVLYRDFARGRDDVTVLAVRGRNP